MTNSKHGNKTEVVSLRMSKSELDEISAKAKEAGLRLSEYLRRQALALTDVHGCDLCDKPIIGDNYRSMVIRTRTWTSWFPVEQTKYAHEECFQALKASALGQAS